jgi:glycosyltransferase involved in cell wall biosynthesis
MTSVSRLPLPPPLRGSPRGWPWEAPRPEGARPGANDSGWPRIAVVTPSFNQGRFLEATLRSVLLQDYPNLEFRVMDGGSADDSVDIIRHYDKWLDGWESNKDGGQSDAINRGFAQAGGQVLAWLNSDDMYAPDALWAIGAAFRKGTCDVVSGHALFVDESGGFERRFAASPVDVSRLLQVRGGFTAPQQSTFWSRSCWERHGPLSTDLHYVMDYEFWIKLAAAGERWTFLDRDLSLFRHHSAQKTADIPSNTRMLTERRIVLERFLASRLCTPGLARHAARGLREIRVKHLRVSRPEGESAALFRVRMLKAAFRHPGCLLIPAFHGLLLRAGGAARGKGRGER